ncbi:MAG TPA: hypothetical protein VF798_05040, partial [Burkholderiaceae bacterium]
MQRAIKAAGIQTIRFPGGDVGNYWDWQAGTVYPVGKASKTQDGLGALAELARATGTYPLYNINVMTLNNVLIGKASRQQAIDNQLHMLETAHGMGLPIQDIELGNEFYWSSPDHDRAFPEAADYAAAMNEWAARIKHAYPGARIASMASIPASGDARTGAWNGAVIGKIQEVEAVTLHRYDSIVDGGVWDGAAPEAALGNVFSDWEKIVSDEVMPIEKAKLRIWVTEFGGLKDCTSNAHFTGTWLEALYQAQMAVQFLSRASIDQIELYNVTGSTASLMFQNTSAYWDACLNKNIVFHATPGDLTATGQAYALIGAALKQEEYATPLVFPETPTVRPSAGTPYPSVTGVALTGHNNQWILLNLSSKPVTLHYPGMGQGTMESLYAPALTTMVTSEHGLTRET